MSGRSRGSCWRETRSNRTTKLVDATAIENDVENVIASAGCGVVETATASTHVHDHAHGLGHARYATPPLDPARQAPRHIERARRCSQHDGIAQ